MRSLFTICFGVGIGFTVLSFLFGEVLSNIDFDFDFDFDFGTGVSPIKPTILATFLTVFGGVGLLLYEKTYWYIVLIGAFIVAFIIAFALFWLVIVPLNKAQNNTAVEMQSLIGHNAKVTETIPQGGYGKIIYVANGNTYSAPAKSEDGSSIDKMQAVEIVYIEKNTYYVRTKTI